MPEDAPTSPTITFPPELPITARVDDIADAVARHPVVIVAGATGSGKTTQLPKILRAMGRGARGLIGVTQPRRIAATSVAARVAKELGTPLGEDVGYQIRFEDRSSARTSIKFMTDGVLLAAIHGDPDLRRYDTLVIDEAHERSLTIDFLLGWIRRLLPRRPDLKVVVSSATLETERFSAFFGGAPVVQVEGRTYPVDVLYAPPAPELDLADAVADAVADVVSLDPTGDVLAFLPGEREIREAESALSARALRNVTVQPLYARLTAAEQSRVFAPIPGRRVILATNVAETSITIPGIVYVVDAGVARLSRYDPRSGVTRLQVEAISRASAEQRKGRCGRVREGVCVRLYDEQSFAARPAFTDPEIKRTGLAAVILRMKSLGLGEVEDFPFLDPPPSRAVSEGYRVLEELGAIDGDRALTPLGRKLARLPIDPRVARMILAGADGGCLDDVLVIAAALELQDPRDRPRELQQRADELHRRFRDDRSDFAGLLRLWDFVREAESKGTSHLRRVCRDNFLSFLRVREWRDVHRQLQETVRELRLPSPKARDVKPAPKPDDADAPVDRALHTAILTGIPSRVGQWHPQHRVYVGARETRFAVHPSSALAKKAAPWVMAYELVETSQLFARTVARVDPAWILDAAPHLVKRSFTDPHWSERSARAMVRENATMLGLPIYRDRATDYAKVAPAQARLMFIDHALVRGEYKTKGRFMAHNAEVRERAQRLRDKARRSSMVVDDGAILDFFDQRVPLDVTDGKGFEAWREKAELKKPDLLHLTLDDVLAGEADLVPADYPDAVTLHGVALPLDYRFDPSADDDGVTVTAPLVLLPQLAPGELDWTIPAWLRDKVAALLNQAPRAVRKSLGSVTDLAAAVADELTPFDGPMVPAVARVASRLAGTAVDEDALRAEAVAPHLRLTLRVVDERGQEVAKGRDVDEILARFGARARAAWKGAAAPAQWERKGLTAWTFGDLPDHVARRVGGAEVRSFPALFDRGASVDLTLMESAPAAEEATRGGLRRLVAIATRGVLANAAQRLPGPFPRLDGAPFGRDEGERFRAALLARVVDDAFGLVESPPRSKDAFERAIRDGAPKVDPTARRYADAVQAASAELAKTLQALRAASKQPSGATAMREMRAQLETLFPPGLVEHVPLARLAHYPRYLRAVQVRLGRAVDNPRKDADKLEPLAPVWAAFLAKFEGARDREAAWALRWSFEELRVSIFAPELTTPAPVSLAKVSAAVAALR
jgi:ATP-dependent helicase HrpA